MSKRYKNNFDFLRLIAAALVILRHSFGLSGNHDPLILATNGNMHLGQLGVAVFFSISGYLISISLIHSNNWMDYIWKRFLRIFPGLIVCVLIIVFILGPLVTTLPLSEYFTSSGTWGYLSNISLYKLQYDLPGVFENNIYGPAVNGSLWTLAYEFTFYFLLLIISITGLLKRNALIVGLLLVLILRFYLGDRFFVYNYSTNLLLGLNITKFYEFFLYFFLGALVYYFRDYIRHFGKLFVLFLVCYIVLIYFSSDYARIGNYFLIVSLTFYVSFLPGKTNEIGKIGDLSYGLYIYSFPIQQVIIMLLPNISVFTYFVLSLLGVIPIAYASWHLIEKPFLKLKSLTQKQESVDA